VPDVPQLFLFVDHHANVKKKRRPPRRGAVVTPEAERFAALEHFLLARDCMVHFSTIKDEHGTLIGWWFRGDGGDRREGCVMTLSAAVQALTGAEAGKVCGGRCGKVLPLDAYSRDTGQGDGHNRCCKVCERQRVKEYALKKRAAEVPSLAVACRRT
jgi:hypothetical protein